MNPSPRPIPLEARARSPHKIKQYIARHTDQCWCNDHEFAVVGWAIPGLEKFYLSIPRDWLNTKPKVGMGLWIWTWLENEKERGFCSESNIFNDI